MLNTERETRAPLVPYNGVPKPGSPAARLKAALTARGLHILLRWNFLFVAPPLCITTEELERGLALIDEALTEVFG